MRIVRNRDGPFVRVSFVEPLRDRNENRFRYRRFRRRVRLDVLLTVRMNGRILFVAEKNRRRLLILQRTHARVGALVQPLFRMNRVRDNLIGSVELDVFVSEFRQFRFLFGFENLVCRNVGR